jgi:hypothetical protein
MQANDSSHISGNKDMQDMIEAFDIARKIWLSNKDTSPQNAVTNGSVRLYSCANPTQELADEDSFWNHFSPMRICDRLRHADRKDALYFDSWGNVYRPGLEVRLSTQGDAYRLQQALVPHTPAYSPLLSPLWRVIIRSAAYLLTVRQRFAGEKILVDYCADDRTYFGSVYINTKGQFLCVHGRTREAVERGMHRLKCLLSDGGDK